jgi:NADPH-dependent 2,4-dienoyl-CoA reductase/sulfur reductase-like enzyme
MAPEPHGATAPRPKRTSDRDQPGDWPPAQRTGIIAAQAMAGQKNVVVVGGGVAGLTVAHELGERGFRVTLFDRQAVPGGKARSVRVPCPPVPP